MAEEDRVLNTWNTSLTGQQRHGVEEVDRQPTGRESCEYNGKPFGGLCFLPEREFMNDSTGRASSLGLVLGECRCFVPGRW